MSNLPQQTKQDLDNLARAQQMKINARLTALQCAQTLMAAPLYGGTLDHITLIAMSQDIESYILGDIEDETKKALEAAAAKLNAPRIVRP